MKHKTRLKDERTIRRYSDSFKLKVLDDLENGRMNKNEIARHYDIGMGTLYGWIKKFSRLDLYNPQLIIQMPQERDRIKSLEQEIKELKEALVQSQLKQLKAESDLEATLELMGVNKDQVAKKHSASHLRKRSDQGSK
jgi:transposase-like protein